MKTKSVKKSRPGNRTNSKAKRTVRTEGENVTDFLEAVNNAPEGKALMTEKTKGYYRFSKKFPSVVDGEGYRLNTKPNAFRKKLTVILTAVLCATVFCITVIAVKTGIIISEIAPDDITPIQTETEEKLVVRFDYDAWKVAKQKTETQWKDNGVTGLLIDIKEPDGTITYDLDGDNIKYILSSLKESGFETYGYISCLKDKSYAYNFPGNCVYTKDGDGTVLYDSDGYAYINPFSEDGIDYVKEIIKAAAKLDFTYFILDEVTLPIKTGSKSPYFFGYSGGKNEINNTLISVVKTFISSAGSEKVIFTTDIYGFYTTENVTGTRYEGRLYPLICKLRAVDLRISEQNTTGKDPLELIAQIKNLPTVFLLEGASLAVEESPENVVLYAFCDKQEDAQYIRASGIHNIIVNE